MKKLELVDFFRGFAIFTIVLMHLIQGSLSGVLYKAASFGGAGVHVFILVSGFGLYLSYLHKPLGYDEFLKKRFGKVYKPYAIIVVATVIWQWLLGYGLLLKEGIAHLLLYKMFDTDLDVSLCYPFWFISTIIQFYICWPLIVRLARVDGKKSSIGGWGLLISGLISFGWATVVGLLGYNDMRPWCSCFLQYLWEFVLGMWLAQRYAERPERFNIDLVKWIWILAGAVVGMGLTGFMGWEDGILKQYNDIPSLLAYVSCLLIVYKISHIVKALGWISRFFIWTSGFGYELYLVHSLVYGVIGLVMGEVFPLPVRIVVSLVMAYAVAWGYSKVLKLKTS